MIGGKEREDRRLGVEQVALGVGFFEMDGVAAPIAVAGNFQRPSQNPAPQLESTRFACAADCRMSERAFRFAAAET
ncbi:hypothetical protein EGJ05_20035 [Stutzerimonas xanthomarina]|nr:hypothetical protein EGJ05_20035 [Stutzerimonas xanthomarina]RRU91160.1 hypothetical protein EGI97_19965 [Stutzerimonas xanthomarina]